MTQAGAAPWARADGVAVGGWTLVATPAGAHADPSTVPGGLIPAPVPGTAAQALVAAGLWRADAPTPLHDQDIWYQTTLVGEGDEVLRFEGLATHAEIFLDGVKLHRSETMFAAQEVPVALAGTHDLAIVFRALAPHLPRSRPRARWRVPMIAHDGLRFLRTTLLGHVPGWSPAIDTVGPFRAITRRPARAPVVTALSATLDGSVGRLSVTLRPGAVEGPVTLVCAGRETPLATNDNGLLTGDLALPGIAPWWPHSHGEPALHPASLRWSGGSLDLGPVGFRTIAIDRGADGRGFGLVVNGVPVFCRGVCWTPPDPVGLASDVGTLRPVLEDDRAAGITMIRVGGTMVPESEAFFALCDELGILVWQDFMFANMDYPIADPAFRQHVVDEAATMLARSQGHPCLAVTCGGSEVAQQAAMLGYPAEAWGGALFEEVLPSAVARWRPDVPYVANSPWGGPLPFVVDEGVGHYYGVGAYKRPLDDARRANVRFAAECLAFANVPEAATVGEAHLGAPGQPRWRAATPRDANVSWDFEDIRDHYLGLLYGVDPMRLRGEDPERYLTLSRAVSAEVIAETMGEWRRVGSVTRGALVWFGRDLVPGAGWGIVDGLGRLKSAWHGLRRASRPLHLAFTDEGVNGLVVHLVHERDRPLRATLDVSCLRQGQVPVARGSKPIVLEGRGAEAVPVSALFGQFFDATYAFRFGPCAHDASVARLIAEDGTIVAEALHFPTGRTTMRGPTGLAATLVEVEGAFHLDVTTELVAQSVHVTAEGAWEPLENWFHLAPGRVAHIPLRRRPGGTGRPRGTVAAVNASETISFG